MKKFLAVLMTAILLLGILAGCNTNTDTPSGTEGTGENLSTPVAAGMLVLNANATVNISYDADGLVLNVEGADDDGSILAGEYEDYLGKSCSDAVCDLIHNSKLSGFLTAEVSYIMIKQAVGSALPGATFLETIQKDAEAALTEAESTAKVVLLTEENLDEDGYIDLESAKQLMLAYLALDSFDTLDGTVAPINGMYGFAVTAGHLEGDFIVDAVTGDVFEGELEGADYTDEELEENIPELDATDEAIAEEPAAATVATEPAVEEPNNNEAVADPEA